MQIRVNNLNFRYRNAKDPTISDLSFSMDKGEVVSIFGQSGSGKSTILRLLAGLETPEEGTIEIDDRIMVDDKTFVYPEKRGIGMVFQDYALFPHMTVEQNIKFGLGKLPKDERADRVDEVLELVGLLDYKDRYPHELSGGQQQRVALARAIAPRPSLLLLDEPFSNLDADLQGKIRQDLKVIIRKSGITSIFVTHDKEDSLAIADRVVVLEKGRVVKVGEAKDIFMRIEN